LINYFIPISEKDRLVAASFGAWQTLAAHTDKLPPWNKYLKNIGLSNEPKLSKDDLKREADQAMKNVQRIISKAKKAGS
jgi:hypothetical protein